MAVINAVSGWRARLDGQYAYLYWNNGAGLSMSMPLASFTIQSDPLFMPHDGPPALPSTRWTARITKEGR